MNNRKYIILGMIIVICMCSNMREVYAMTADEAIKEIGTAKPATEYTGENSPDKYHSIATGTPEKCAEWWNALKDLQNNPKYKSQAASLRTRIDNLVSAKELEWEKNSGGTVKVTESKTSKSDDEILKQSDSDIEKLSKKELEGQKKKLEEKLASGKLSKEEEKKYKEMLEKINKKIEKYEKYTESAAKNPDELLEEKKATGNYARFESTQSNKEHTPDEILTEADKFVEDGANAESPIATSSMKNVSNTIYNIFFAIGVAASVIMGAVLGIKFMLSNVDGKAEIKESLIPYIVGCTILFSAFGIWKLVLIIVSNI